MIFLNDLPQRVMKIPKLRYSLMLLKRPRHCRGIDSYGRKCNHRCECVVPESFTRKLLSDRKFGLRLPKYLIPRLVEFSLDRSMYRRFCLVAISGSLFLDTPLNHYQRFSKESRRWGIIFLRSLRSRLRTERCAIERENARSRADFMK